MRAPRRGRVIVYTYGHRSIRSAAGQVTSGLFKGVTTDLSYVHADFPDGEGPSIAMTGNGPKQIENADLIAEMRSALPLLLEVVEAAQALQDSGGMDTYTGEADMASVKLRAALSKLDSE